MGIKFHYASTSCPFECHLPRAGDLVGQEGMPRSQAMTGMGRTGEERFFVEHRPDGCLLLSVLLVPLEALFCIG